MEPERKNPDQDGHIDTLARTLYGEARGELFGGRVAVACVIRNRVEKGGWFGTDFRSVCLKPWQFSCWNRGDPNRAVIEAVTADDAVFAECLEIARQILGGNRGHGVPPTQEAGGAPPAAPRLPDITFGARHYHTDAMGFPASWGERRQPVIKIGAHLFYNDVD